MTKRNTLNGMLSCVVDKLIARKSMFQDVEINSVRFEILRLVLEVLYVAS